MQIKKLTLNAFVVGFVFMAVAIFVAPEPTSWWLWTLGLLTGAVAGIISGYFVNDFQEVREKVPLVWEKVRSIRKSEFVEDLEEYFSVQRPNFFLTVLTWAVFSAFFSFFLMFVEGRPFGPLGIAELIILFVMLPVALTIFFIGGACKSFVNIGAKALNVKEHEIYRNGYGPVFNFLRVGTWEFSKTIASLFFAVFVKFPWAVLKFLVRDLPWFMVAGVTLGLMFLFQLFIQVHSYERQFSTACGLAGGTITWVLLGIFQPSLTFGLAFMVCLFSGVIAMGVAFAECKLVCGKLIPCFDRLVPSPK